MKSATGTSRGSHAAPVLSVGAGLLIVATAGCAGTPAAQTERSHTPAAISPRTAGREVPESTVRVPATVAAFATLEGRAPPHSVVDTQSERVTVGDDGRFQLKAPSEGTWTIRVRRPAPLTPLRFDVSVIGGQRD